VQQPNAEAFLQSAHHLAQGRRGDAELLRRPGEIEYLRDCYERAELTEIAGRNEGIIRAHRLIA